MRFASTQCSKMRLPCLLRSPRPLAGLNGGWGRAGRQGESRGNGREEGQGEAWAYKSSVNFGGRHFCAKICVWKIQKIPKFYQFAKNDYYPKIFFFWFLFLGGRAPPTPISYTWGEGKWRKGKLEQGRWLAKAGPAIWNHTVLPATRHRWMHPTLTSARNAGTRLTYPRRMEGWVDLGGWLHTKVVYLSAGSHRSN